MKSSTVIIIIAVLLLFGGAMYFINKEAPVVNPDEVENPEGNVPEVVSVNYLCEGGSSIVAAYNNTDENVSLSLSDERIMTLDQVVSDDGARYANADESIVFWSVGDQAFLDENGVTTFAECLAEGASAEETEVEPEVEVEAVEAEAEASVEAVLEEGSAEEAAE